MKDVLARRAAEKIRDGKRLTKKERNHAVDILLTVGETDWDEHDRDGVMG